MKDPELERSYRLMLLSRAVDEACDDLSDRGHAVPNYHGARGQEALYAGVGVALKSDDYLLFNYRAFATLLAKGVTLEQLMGDLLSNTAGTTRGHGGIMHVNAPGLGIPGRNGVFGSKFGIALGLAQEIQLNDRDAAVVCMFGEAEGNRGGLYEAMNVAALRALPIVFIAENNGFAVAATTDLLYATGDMSGGVKGFPMPVRKIDGNDSKTTAREVGAAATSARAGKGPSFIECVTLRLDPHHAHDDQMKYRTTDELERAWTGEPIAVAEQQLRATGWTDEDLASERDKASVQVKTATEAALAAAPADASVVTDYTYYRGGR